MTMAHRFEVVLLLIFASVVLTLVAVSLDDVDFYARKPKSGTHALAGPSPTMPRWSGLVETVLAVEDVVAGIAL
ncbi:hypothetical protein [Mesorhizobium sp. IMUNJ 23232]|uniref:hypothetical protein n=1 Tax=Mesorhizobium sp. IMUNJ 23232 TaxID=3376064 RepID=UPI00379E8CDA